MNLTTEFKGLPVEEAAFYCRLGLQIEVLTLPDVSDWVDEVLLNETELDPFFVQLYRLLRKGKLEALVYLRNAVPENSFSVRPVLGWIQQQFECRCLTLRQTIKSLYRLRTLVDSTLEVGWIYGLAADYERAADDPMGTATQEVQRDTEAFLSCYREYTFANRLKWHHLDAVLEQRLANTH